MGPIPTPLPILGAPGLKCRLAVTLNSRPWVAQSSIHKCPQSLKRLSALSSPSSPAGAQGIGHEEGTGLHAFLKGAWLCHHESPAQFTLRSVQYGLQGEPSPPVPAHPDQGRAHPFWLPQALHPPAALPPTTHPWRRDGSQPLWGGPQSQGLLIILLEPNGTQKPPAIPSTPKSGG